MSTPKASGAERSLHDKLNPKGEKASAVSVAEQEAAREAEIIKKCNSPSDKQYRPTISVPKGRDPKADLSMFEGAKASPSASRVKRSKTRASAHPHSEGASRPPKTRHGRGGSASDVGGSTTSPDPTRTAADDGSAS